MSSDRCRFLLLLVMTNANVIGSPSRKRTDIEIYYDQGDVTILEARDTCYNQDDNSYLPMLNTTAKILLYKTLHSEMETLYPSRQLEFWTNASHDGSTFFWDDYPSCTGIPTTSSLWSGTVFGPTNDAAYFKVTSSTEYGLYPENGRQTTRPVVVCEKEFDQCEYVQQNGGTCPSSTTQSSSELRSGITDNDDCSDACGQFMEGEAECWGYLFSDLASECTLLYHVNPLLLSYEESSEMCPVSYSEDINYFIKKCHFVNFDDDETSISSSASLRKTCSTALTYKTTARSSTSTSTTTSTPSSTTLPPPTTTTTSTTRTSSTSTLPPTTSTSTLPPTTTTTSTTRTSSTSTLPPTTSTTTLPPTTTTTSTTRTSSTSTLPPTTSTTTLPPTTTTTSTTRTSSTSTLPPTTSTTTLPSTTTTPYLPPTSPLTSNVPLTTTVTTTSTLAPNTTVTTTMPLTTTSPSITTALRPTSTIFPTETTFVPLFIRSCLCSTNSFDSLTLSEVTDLIVKELTIDASKTSATIRSKTSARDDRSSSVSIGVVAMLFIIIPLIFIVVSDVVGFFCNSPKHKCSSVERL